jgi:hypothetical protein
MAFAQVWDDKVHLFGGEAVHAHFFVYADWSEVDDDPQHAFAFLVSVRVAGIQFWASQQVPLQNGAVDAELDPTVATIATGQLPRAIHGEIDDCAGINDSGAVDWARATSVRFLLSSKADVTLPVALLGTLVGRLGGTAGLLVGLATGLFHSKVRLTIGHSNVAIPIHRDGRGFITQINTMPRP